MTQECQKPTVSGSNGQQFPIIPAQGLNMHVWTFAPMQYYVTGPLRSQPILPGPMLLFNQASGPPRPPILGNVRPAENGMVQGQVTAPAPGQQLLN